MRFFGTLPHTRKPAVEWLAKAASEFRDLSVPVFLRVDGRKVDEITEQLRTELSQVLGCAVGTSSRDAPMLVRAELG